MLHFIINFCGNSVYLKITTLYCSNQDSPISQRSESCLLVALKKAGLLVMK